MLPTANLHLVLLTPEETIARIDALSPADRAEVSPDWLARVRAATPNDPWALGFSLVEQASGLVVGDCGYKGPPDSSGSVEIAYAVAPESRGRGYATEAAKALIDFALTQQNVRRVFAHTRPDNMASIRVAIKCGLVRIGEVMDPEDGLVLRWEVTRSANAILV
jgi:ribosomal-protein-alanine N-acetyltransferase